MPEDFFDAVERGVDLFDCVTPTRHARNHNAFTSTGRVNLRNAAWREDASALDAGCDCTACTQFSRGTLRHLCQSNEMLAGMLLTLHNLRFFHRLMADIRQAVFEGRVLELRAKVLSAMAKSE
jgi:queuine tRNA-ribosyltransferase